MKNASTAFSLVELVVALAIVSFALLPILATLPLGLSNLRQSIDQTVVSTILCNVESKVRQIPFASLSTLDSGTDYFDEGGVFLGQLQQPSSRYSVTYKITTPDLPASGSAPEIKVVLLTISSPVASSTADSRFSVTHPLLVARQNEASGTSSP